MIGNNHPHTIQISLPLKLGPFGKPIHALHPIHPLPLIHPRKHDFFSMCDPASLCSLPPLNSNVP